MESVSQNKAFVRHPRRHISEYFEDMQHMRTSHKGIQGPVIMYPAIKGSEGHMRTSRDTLGATLLVICASSQPIRPHEETEIV